MDKDNIPKINFINVTESKAVMPPRKKEFNLWEKFLIVFSITCRFVYEFGFIALSFVVFKWKGLIIVIALWAVWQFAGNYIVKKKALKEE